MSKEMTIEELVALNATIQELGEHDVTRILLMAGSRALQLLSKGTRIHTVEVKPKPGTHQGMLIVTTSGINAVVLKEMLNLIAETQRTTLKPNLGELS